MTRQSQQESPPLPVTEVEEYLTMAQAGQTAPGCPTSAAVWRWCQKGLKAHNSTVINLRHIRVGGRVYTKKEWIDQFFDDLASADLEHFSVQHPNRTKLAQLPPSHYEANAALEEAGM